MNFARVVNDGLVAEVFPEVLTIDEVDVPLTQCLHADIVATLIEVPDGVQVQPGWAWNGTAFAAPLPPPETTHGDLEREVMETTRAERQSVMKILDGLQSSALTNADAPLAQQIETIKVGLRDITTLDLSGDADAEAMRDHVKATYDALIATAPGSVKQAFAGL